MTKNILRKPAASATEKPKSVKPAPAGLPPNKPYPPLTLISRATAKYPLADTDPRKHLNIISRRLRDVVLRGGSLYDLTALDEENPVIVGTSYFLDVLMDKVSDLADGIDDVVGMLHVKGEV